MTALPPSTDFTGASITEAQFKTAITALRDYLSGLFSATGTIADARTTLQVPANQTTATSDLNTITSSGMYRLEASLTNAPPGADYGQLLVVHGGADTIGQLCFIYSTGDVYARAGNPSDVGGTGSWSAWKKLGGDSSLQIFTSSGTWTKPAGLKRVKVTVVGGGGGGANDIGTISKVNGSGAGGGTSIKWIDAGSLGATESVTIGGGGAGATGATAAAGGSGGTSSFGAHCNATGGGGGGALAAYPSGVNPSVGGIGSGGHINMAGGNGYVTSLVYNSEASSTSYKSPDGGFSSLGAGGRGVWTAGHGQAGRSPGAGGAAGNSNSSSDYNGGSGAAGVVIVEEFF